MGDYFGGINQKYLDNIVDAINVAKENSMYILFASTELPVFGGYRGLADMGRNEHFVHYRSADLLTSEGILAGRLYWSDLLEGLISRNAPFDAILGWELLHEQWMSKMEPPLSLMTGVVTTANKKYYNLSSPEQRNAMVSEGVIFYIDKMREVILDHDPTALITMGFFPPRSPNKIRIGRGLYVETRTLLEGANLDFFDFHVYPGEDTLRHYAENFGIIDFGEKPIVMGEYGVNPSDYSSIWESGPDIAEWLQESCKFGFDGWLYWSYYAMPEQDEELWSFTDADGYLMENVSPLKLPDPCFSNET
jgi:hypothetical protein